MAGNVFSPKSHESPTKGVSFVCTDSPVFQASGKHDGGEDDGDTEEGVGSGDLVHFEAIIPLPEKVDVVTGEEEEKVVFQERCKLYRYDKETKQWKERGVGNMKLLRDVRRGRARVVMRREQVHKLCANHLITPQMDLKPSGSAAKAWTWQTLADVSEKGEGKVEELAVRFKTQAVAQEFKEKFEECRDTLKSVAEIGQSEEDTGEDEASNEAETSITQGATQTETGTSAESSIEESRDTPSDRKLEASSSTEGSSANSPQSCTAKVPAASPTCSPEISELLDSLQKEDPDCTKGE